MTGIDWLLQLSPVLMMLLGALGAGWKTENREFQFGSWGLFIGGTCLLVIVLLFAIIRSMEQSKVGPW